MKRKVVRWLVVLMGLSAPLALGALTQITSGAQRACMIEVFTSEGCSSCPPADNWLSGLVEHPDLWKHYIPLGWHVDYWNDLGWVDRFSSRDYSVRQRRYRLQGGSTRVYTPGFMVNGREWRAWFKNREDYPRYAGGEPPSGVLQVDVDSERFTARYEQMHPGQVLHLAVLGFALENNVRAGENNNKVLKHDFVVLAHRSYPLRYARETWNGRLPTTSVEARRYALVAWVSERGRNQPLQAAGGWLR